MTDPVRALDDAWRMLWRVAARVPPAECVITSDITMGTLHVPIPPLNGVTTTRFSPESADARITEVVAWYHERHMPCLWWVGPTDTPTDLAERLLARGFVEEEGTVPGMVANLDRLPDEPGPPGIEVARVEEPTAYRETCDIMAAGFGLPLEVADAFERLASLGFEDDVSLRTFIARIDGRPVGTSLGVLGEGTVGIFNVATLPDARGRGVGRAVTLAAMRDAAEHGAGMAVLQSSPISHSVYERLGFDDVAHYRIFVGPPG